MNAFNEFETLEEAARGQPAVPDYEPPGEPIAPQRPAEFKAALLFCAAYTPLSYALEPLIRSSSIYTLTAKTGSGKTAFLIRAAAGDCDRPEGRSQHRGFARARRFRGRRKSG